MGDHLYHSLAEQVDDNLHLLANVECIENKRFVAHAINPRAEHKILYEQEQQNDQIVEKEYIVYLIGRTGTCAEGQRVRAAGAMPADVPVSNGRYYCITVLITVAQIMDRAHVKLNFTMKAITLDNVDMTEIWTNQRLRLQEVQYALVGGEQEFMKLKNDPNNVGELIPSTGQH